MVGNFLATLFAVEYCVEKQKKCAIMYAASGAFDTENRLKYSFQSVFNAVPALHFRDDKVSIAKIRLVPITVSQLKCALHILIGIVSKKSPTCHCEERSDVVAQPFARNERYGCGIPPAGAI